MAFSVVHAKALEATSQDIGDFWAPSISIKYLDNPTPEEFLREAVASFTPVIIRGAISHWPALHKWDLDYFEDQCEDESFPINLTPDGLADSIKATVDDGT